MGAMIGEIYNKLALQSPRIEVLLRKLYWQHVSLLKKYSTNKTNRVHRTEFVDFEEIVDFLKGCGIGKGDLVIMHSSYGNLKPTSLDNYGIVNRLLDLVGKEGTLAAPVIRLYKEEQKMTYKEMMDDGLAKVKCEYDVDKTPISSGVLAITLKEHEESVTSLFPLNPLTAVGKYAKEMMANNIEGDCPSAHGSNSCWKFCADHNAYVIYLGIDFGHHITMQQVFTEAFPENTPKNFFVKREFKLVHDGKAQDIIVKERRRAFTTVLPEMNVRKDIVKSGIVKMTKIHGIPVSVFRSKDLLEFYGTKRKYYPYLV